jgi:xanthine dehydrogenase iron-sulfur cluster and FAD-binding subunit A
MLMVADSVCPAAGCYTGGMRDHLSFVLNGEVLTLRGIDPAMTLLTYLRRERRLTGTKEGCAEGDCGACTVTVGELDGAGGIRYRALNACILLMGMLEGRSVTTVERLKGKDGALHPVQQAMVEAHGSQCGFCTPGIVMSLYTAYLGEGTRDVARINDVLAGNLCRCTGYGPIVTAAQAMHGLPRPADAAEETEAEIARLDAIAHAETIMIEAAGGGVVRGARIAFGGMAGTPKRAAHVEAALTGRPWSLASVTAALPAFERDYAPITDMRASAGYRMQVAKNLLVKSFHETERPLRESRLVGREAAFT